MDFWTEFLWSVWFTVFCPKRMFLNSFRVSTIERSSLSVAVHLSCARFSFLEWKAVGFPSCAVTEPSLHFLASVCMTNCLLKSGKDSKVSLAMTLFISEKALSCSFVQLNFVSAEVSLVSGAKISDLLGHMSLQKFTIPKKELTDFLFQAFKFCFEETTFGHIHFQSSFKESGQNTFNVFKMLVKRTI